MFIRLLILFTVIVAANSCEQSPIYLSKKFASKQILVVKTAHPDSIQGQLVAYDWSDENQQWLIASKTIPIVVGDSGLAWGMGLHDDRLNQKPFKKEGDKKSPVGIFYLSSLFGYDAGANLGALKMPYIRADSTIFCVDDPLSKYYNRIVDVDTVKKDWQSAEYMLLDSIYYKYGVVIDYNFPQTRPGNGSCIFLHVWNNACSGTFGCTATEENTMKDILLWLDQSKKPILIQASEKDYEKLRDKYFLP